MFSSTNKLHEFITPSIATKAVFDQYQKTLGIDLWRNHYEKMQEKLKHLKEVNMKLRTDIRRRFGECLNDLKYEELHHLEEDVESSVMIIRDRKYKVLSNQIDTHKKKLRNSKEINSKLLHEFEDPDYGKYDSITGARIYALRLQPNQPNLHNGAAGSQLTTYPLLE